MNGDTSISCNLSNCDCDKPKAPHALTREQCSLCTANRPRLCDQHYKQGADELLKHVTAAIQDQQTPGGVKATYEQLLELCNRHAFDLQVQELQATLAAREARVHDLERGLAAVLQVLQPFTEAQQASGGSGGAANQGAGA